MIKGRWHPKDSAKSFDAYLEYLEGNYKIVIEDEMQYQGEFSDLEISPRLGNVDRKIILHDGSVFLTRDNDQIDVIVKKIPTYHTLLHMLESRMRWVVVAIVVVLFSTYAFFKWGIPWSSQKIAHALPYKTNELIAGNTLEFLDKYLFDESNLTVEKQEQIRKHFKEKIVPVSHDKKIVYKFHFRSWDDIPNALALPSGDIVLTDKFIELSANQDEIDAIVLHEMGHVVHRHSLEMVIESAFISMAVMLIVGDVNVLADVGVGLGSLLVSSSYSRGHESEADLYAFEKMLRLGIDPISFSNVMNRMTTYMEHKKEAASKETENKADDQKWIDYLSTHPTTERRMEIAGKYSECYKKGLKECEVK